ncbi:alternate-type signal peptide domain-containing protein [Georgenia yuyongxinii]|uniref:Alternate-type signal peptide domain-containing protein n=1 Tax=Georgenia yuyongxinii TaxID=2589797 RepID=A0A552WML0_9MICO|nr:alternate-type signal peptide domain-containing protein [Georgenia yuyongxinii]TRW43819.1 alternate-type signal peptide domain-containing protein [Georgenia yuyongxinii]
MSRTARKTTAAALAGGAAIAVLAAGGGTFALWQADATVDAATITAGSLTLTAEAPTWTVNGASLSTDLDEFRMVPGDTVAFTAPVTVGGEGLNLRAEIGVEIGRDVLPTGPGIGDLLWTSSTVEILKNGKMEGSAPFAEASSLAVEAAPSDTVAVVGRLRFPFDDGVVDNDTQGAVITIGEVKVTATQVDASPDN